MRLVKWAIVADILLALAVFLWTFSPARLSVDEVGGAGMDARLPPVTAQAMPQVSVLMTGRMQSLEVFAYRGGALAPLDFGMAAVLLRHPGGNFLIDAGFGRNLEQHLRAIPWLMRQTSRTVLDQPLADGLAAAGLAPADLVGVVLTHAHWDHVSGLDDLPAVPVWINQTELDFIRDGGHVTALARSLGARDYRIYAFDNGPYGGFAQSHDLFGDGTVVLAHAGAHTPGSVVVFVAAADGRRYAFIGDLAWHHRAVEIPAQRPWVTRVMVDEDPAAVREALVRLHRLQQANPDLVIVPAHDHARMMSLPSAANAQP